MPDRVIRAKILGSDMVNQLTWPAEVFYRRLMSVVDDYGRYDARASILRSYLYPLKLDRVSEADVAKWKAECANTGLVSFYEVEGKEYLEIKQFDQRLRAMKSKYPEPADICGHPLSSADKCNGKETETETEKKRNTPNGGNGATAPPDDSLVLYKQVEKTKAGIYSFLKTKPLIIEPYVDFWNLFAAQHGLAKVEKVSDSRKRKFKVRVREQAFSFPEILRKAGLSEFLRTGKWFGFDWLIENDSNYLKVLEGNYDGKKAAEPVAKDNNLSNAVKQIESGTN